LQLELLSETHAVARLGPEASVPSWAGVPEAVTGGIVAVARTQEELSIVCPQRLVEATADGLEASVAWRVLRVAGTLDHGMTGVLASLAAPLAEAAIPIFAMSTFDTDYLLVPEGALGAAIRALRVAGHDVDHPEGA
jgi:hypothetical protein